MSAVTASLCSTLLFVGLFVFVSAEQKNITAESGQKVILPCRTPNNSTITFVKWSKTGLGEDYVLLYRDGHFDPANQHPSFQNRVDLQDRQMKDGNVSLILKNVMINDTGTYECRVIMSGTKNAPSIITLSVVDPPGQTGGHTEDGGKKDGGKEAEGKEAGSVGLKVGLSVCALLLVAAVVFLIYKKHKQQQNQDSYQPPADQQPA
ncbi:uncharacterized protein LOC112844123 [Oreochromis niloticus]|uniref:uncharacterized protein LOC112844123 n=1 Tax=Oreochromis niloticus TaxID=8128 RepID=UPI000DF2DE39|nr:uncharacterized protein LOC112844123 [Oreochromis niloticus]